MSPEEFFSILNEDKDEQSIRATSKQVSSLIAVFTVQGGKNVDTAPTISIKWDLARDLVNATLTRLDSKKPNRPNIRTWCLSSKREWIASPEFASQHEGTWTVTVSPIGQSPIPRQLNEGEMGMTFLRRAIVPFHLRYPMPDDLENYTIKVTQLPIAGGSVERIYQMAHLNGWQGRLKYTLKVSNGLICILDSEYSEKKNEGAWITSFRGTYSDHVFTNGVWFPKKISEEMGPDLAVKSKRTQLNFESVEVNAVMPAAEFTYKPPFGSYVRDTATHVTYREGYTDPDAPIGHDPKLEKARNAR